MRLTTLFLAMAATAAAATTHTIKMTDAPPYFSPQSLTIDVGDTVMWHNHGPQLEHIVIDDDLRLFSDDVKLNADWSYTFKKPGTYPYICFRHFFMRGEIVVKDKNGSSASVPDFPYQKAFKEYVVPTLNGIPRMVAVRASDQTVWFTEGGGDFYGFEDIPPQNKLGRIDAAGHIVEYATPTPNSDGSKVGVDSLAIDPEGNIWFTERITNAIGELDRQGHIKEFTLPTKGGYALGIDRDPSGMFWFAERYGNRIGFMTAEGKATEIELPEKDSEPRTVFVDRKGMIWYTARVANEIGSYDPAKKELHRVQIPTKMARPAGICQGSTDTLYFVEMVGNKLATLSGDQVTEFPAPTKFSAPFKCAVDSKENVWFTQVYSNSIAKFDPKTQVITEYQVPSIDSRPGGIAVDAKDRVWFTEQKGNKIGMFDPSLLEQKHDPESHPTAQLDFRVPTAGGAPGNELMDDGQGSIWFPEIYGNRLAAIQKSDHSIREIELPGAVSMPVAVARTADGMLWVPEFRGNRLASVDPKSGTIHEFAVPSSGAMPTGICVTSRDEIWFTELGANRIATMDRKAGRIQEVVMPREDSGPLQIACEGDHTLWVTASEEAGNYLASFDTRDRSFEVYPLPNAGSTPVGILLDTAKIWVTEGIGSLASFDRATHAWSEYKIPVPRSEPVRLTKDARGRIWIADGGGFGSPGGNCLAVFDPATKIFEVIPMKTRDAKPLGVLASANGDIWFTQMGANRISIIQQQVVQQQGGNHAGI